MEEQIVKTQEILQPLIKKPTLKEKHLGKPPFRFLHDIFTNMREGNDFPPADLWPEEMLNSQNIKSKEDKMAFLDIAIKFVQLASGEELQVKSQKIVAGHEPENTNVFLQALAKACLNKDSIDVPSIVAQCGGGGGAAPEAEAEAAGAAPEGDAEAGAAEAAAKEEAAADAAAAQAAAADEERRRQQEAEAAAAAAAEEAEANVRNAAEEESAPPATSGGGGGGMSASGLPVDRDVIDLPHADGEFWEPTAAMIGALIEKPKMNPKHLKKPPFRYIHDITTALLRATDFPSDVYSEDELNSKNIKDQPAKLKFLNKLIEFVSVATGADLSMVNPKKIVAGHEPENTNKLLQMMAVGAASGVSCKAVMDKIIDSRSGSAEAEPVQPVPTPAAQPAAARAPRAEHEKPRERPTKGPTKVVGMPKLPLKDLQKEKDQNSYAAPTATESSAADSDASKLKRPKTARRAPPKVKSNLVDEDKGEKDVDGSSGSGATGVILDGEEVQEEEEDETPEEPEQLQGFNDPALDNDGQHGKLVGSILSAQAEDKKKEEGDNFAFKRLRSARKTQANTLYNMKNINDLRQKIQKICQSVNPLGKCIDFVYEDMDQMTKELSKWRQSYQTYLEKYEVEKDKSTRLLEPLNNKLNVVTQDVIEATRKIHSTKALIKRNDDTIYQLLDTHSAV